VSGSRWCSYHLYRADPHDDFLRRALRPFVESLFDARLIE